MRRYLLCELFDLSSGIVKKTFGVNGLWKPYFTFTILNVNTKIKAINLLLVASTKD